MLAFLLEQSCDPCSKALLGDTTFLIVAASMGQAEGVKQLLQRRADTEDKEDEHQRTALLAAAWNGHCDVAEVLLAHHANIEVHDEHGSTPLIAAAQRGHPNVASALLRHGADVHARDDAGYTALLGGVLRGCLETVQLVVAQRADPQAKGSDGKTPIQWALELSGVVDELMDLGPGGDNVQAPLDLVEPVLRYSKVVEFFNSEGFVY